MMLTACSAPSIETAPTDSAAIDRGRTAAVKLGCGTCHAMPGIDWPKGRIGPSLAGFGRRGLVAGSLPNRPSILAAYVLDAPSAVPGSGMPAIAMTDAEAEDIAAWLQSLRD